MELGDDNAGSRSTSSAVSVNNKEPTMRYVLLWALGVPISGLIVLHLFGVI